MLSAWAGLLNMLAFGECLLGLLEEVDHLHARGPAVFERAVFDELVLHLLLEMDGRSLLWILLRKFHPHLKVPFLLLTVL